MAKQARAMLVMVPLLLLAIYLRFHLLGAQSFWNDEGNAYVQATRAFADIAAHAARDIHPPGYYWLLAGWRLLTGETEFALRALSAFASVLSVAFTSALGKRLFGPLPGAIAALLVALNTFSIYYAQEARMYSLLALWAVAGMWVFVGFFRRPGWRSALALALVSAAGLWTQYAYAFVLLAQGVLALLWLVSLARARRLQRFADTFGLYVAASMLALALFWPWLPVALDQITTWPSAGAPAPFAESLGAILNLLTYGPTFAYTAPGALAISNILLLFGLLPALNRRAWWNLLVPVAWVLVSLGVFYAFSLYRPQNLKLLLPAQIALALWLARGLWALWHLAEHLTPARGSDGDGRRLLVTRLAAVAGAVWLLFNLSAGIGPLHADPAYRRADYRAIARRIEAEARVGDAIILDAPNQAEVFGYYYHGGRPIYSLPPGLGGDDDATRAALQTIIAAHRQVYVVFWGEAERDPNRVVETTLDQQAFELGDTWYGDVRLAVYALPVELAETVESGARFGEHVTLLRYALSARALQPGDVLQVRLDWTTDAPLDTRYKVFVQLLSEDGVLVAQRDSEPGGGLALTTTWQPGAVIEDRHALRIPDDLPPAHYLLIVGLYNINDAGARLPVGEDDSYSLGTLTLREATGDEAR